MSADAIQAPIRLMRLAALIACLCGPIPLMAQTAYEAAARGASCNQDTSGARSCHFTIGHDLEIAIAAVGEPDVGISFLRSNQNGDFYGRFGRMHGCVIVMAGAHAPEAARTAAGVAAFISPRNGKVYQTWQECRRAV